MIRSWIDHTTYRSNNRPTLIINHIITWGVVYNSTAINTQCGRFERISIVISHSWKMAFPSRLRRNGSPCIQRKLCDSSSATCALPLRFYRILRTMSHRHRINKLIGPKMSLPACKPDTMKNIYYNNNIIFHDRSVVYATTINCGKIKKILNNFIRKYNIIKSVYIK